MQRNGWVKTKKSAYFQFFRVMMALFVVASLVCVCWYARTDRLTPEERQDVYSELRSIEGSSGVIPCVVDMLERGEIKNVDAIYCVIVRQVDDRFMYWIQYYKGLIPKEIYYSYGGTLVTEEEFVQFNKTTSFKVKLARTPIRYVELTLLLEEVEEQWH